MLTYHISMYHITLQNEEPITGFLGFSLRNLRAVLACDLGARLLAFSLSCHGIRRMSTLGRALPDLRLGSIRMLGLGKA